MWNYEDLIDGAIGYGRISDFIITNNKTPLNNDILEKDAIILCRTDLIDFLFSFIKNSNKNYILITHFTDRHVNESEEQRTHNNSAIFSHKPSCVIKWYATTTTFHHKDLIQIPLGFGIHWEHPNWPRFNEKYRQWMYDNCERLVNIEKNNNTVYCNFTTGGFQSYRDDVVKKLQTSGINCFVREKRIPFPEYCEEMAKYKFVASPPGDGIDAHRNWEALYLGCIPIVLDSMPVASYNGWFTYRGNVRGVNIYENYDLPFLVVDNYSKINYNLLNNYLDYYKKHDFKYEQMNLSYWENKMKNDLKNCSD